MKLVLFRGQEPGVRAGVLVDAGVVDISEVAPATATPQQTMQALIDGFEDRREAIGRLAASATPIPVTAVELAAPLPRPGKVLGCIGNYWEHAQRDARPLNMFLKNPDAVVGPGGVIRLPTTTEPWVFMHEAELAIVVRGPAKQVAEADWRRAVFGYTCLIDVSAREHGRYTWRQGSWLGKSFDTFCPLGPCILTADELPDPNDTRVRLWDDGQLRHDYSTDDMEHRVPELIAFATGIMTMHSGDVIACGTNHEGLGPLQDGERIDIEIDRIGRMTLGVEDPLGRAWEKGVYMGADSTNHEAVRRHRPRADQATTPAPGGGATGGPGAQRSGPAAQPFRP